MYAGWAAPAHWHATCTRVTHYVLLSRIDSYCEAVWNPIIISRQGTSQQQMAGDIGRNNNSQVKRSEPGRAERVTSYDNGLHWPSQF